MLAALNLAIHIVDERAFALLDGNLLLVEECQIRNTTFALKKVVEEIDEERFGNLLSKNPLEPHIGERIDEFRHSFSSLCNYFVLTFSLQMYGLFLEHQNNQEKKMYVGVFFIASSSYGLTHVVVPTCCPLIAKYHPSQHGSVRFPISVLFFHSLMNFIHFINELDDFH